MGADHKVFFKILKDEVEWACVNKVLNYDRLVEWQGFLGSLEEVGLPHSLVQVDDKQAGWYIIHAWLVSSLSPLCSLLRDIVWVPVVKSV